MSTITIRFRNKLPDRVKSEKFGFKVVDGYYTYSEDVMDGRYRVDLSMVKLGTVSITVTDLEDKVECDAIQCSTATNDITDLCRDLLERISDECFMQVFYNDQAIEIIDYIWKKYRNPPLFLWKTNPNNAVFRHGSKGKWYVGMFSVEREKLGLDGKGSVVVINLKDDDEAVSKLVDNKKYLPGYHMNKGKWYTIVLDGSVTTKEICEHIDRSFEITRR